MRSGLVRTSRLGNVCPEITCLCLFLLYSSKGKNTVYSSVNKQDHMEKYTTFILSVSLPNRKAVTGDSILTVCSLNLSMLSLTRRKD